MVSGYWVEMESRFGNLEVEASVCRTVRNAKGCDITRYRW